MSAAERPTAAPAAAEAEVLPTDAPHSWGWHLVRVSALFLAVGMPLLFVRATLVPDLGRTTAAAVSDRWDQPLWRLTEWLVVALALVHASVAVDARVGSRLGARRPAARVALVVAVVALVGVLTRAMLAAP